MFHEDFINRVGNRISDQYLMVSGIAVALYDWMLIFDDEVRRRKFNPFRPGLLTCPPQRSGTFGEVARRGVRSVVCADCKKRADQRIPQQSSTFTSWCVLPDQTV